MPKPFEIAVHLDVQLLWLEPAADTAEQIEREHLQSKVDEIAFIAAKATEKALDSFLKGEQ